MKATRRFVLRSLQCWHGFLAKCPSFIPKIYISLLSSTCRELIPRSLGRYIEFAICHQGVVWPPLRFNPRKVFVSENMALLIYPHLGEDDAQALFAKRMDYESGVFSWLEANLDRYQLVIEVGANVGIYSCFLDKFARLKGLPVRIICFEPSPLAFYRLQQNLLANKCSSVISNRIAVSTDFGLLEFFEPAGHLKNGSLIESFSQLFADRVTRTSVLGLDVLSLRSLAGPGRTLMKLDVEGYEPQLLNRLKSVLDQWDVDLIVEVLDITCEPIARSLSGLGLDYYLLKEDGLEKHDDLFASQTHRDWLITRNRPTPAAPVHDCHEPVR